MENKQTTSKLPENAYRELKPGEEYEPVMPAGSTPREITSYSVLLGLVMTVIFSAAAAYLGLKVGQVFEAAIPIPSWPLVSAPSRDAGICWGRM